MEKSREQFNFSEAEDQPEFAKLSQGVQEKLVKEAQEEANRVKAKVESGEAKNYEEAAILVEQENLERKAVELHEKLSKLEKEKGEIEQKLEQSELIKLTKKTEKELESLEKEGKFAKAIHTLIVSDSKRAEILKAEKPSLDFPIVNENDIWDLRENCKCEHCRGVRELLNDWERYSSIFLLAMDRVEKKLGVKEIEEMDEKELGSAMVKYGKKYVETLLRQASKWMIGGRGLENKMVVRAYKENPEYLKRLASGECPETIKKIQEAEKINERINKLEERLLAPDFSLVDVSEMLEEIKEIKKKTRPGIDGNRFINDFVPDAIERLGNFENSLRERTKL